MIDSLRRLHPVHHNVPVVWEEFEQAFKDKVRGLDPQTVSKEPARAAEVQVPRHQ